MISSDQPVFFYMDTSVQIKSANFSSIFDRVLRNKGVVIFDEVKLHTNARVTWPNMYEYLPTNLNLQNKTMSFQSTMLYVNTAENYANFMQWHILCSLVKDCIAPTDKRSFQRSIPPQYPACHRYDMSSLNILLSNYHAFKANSYGMTSKDLVQVVRGKRQIAEDEEEQFNKLVRKNSV